MFVCIINYYLLSPKRLMFFIYVPMILRDSRVLRDVRSSGYDYSSAFGVR